MGSPEALLHPHPPPVWSQPLLTRLSHKPPMPDVGAPPRWVAPPAPGTRELCLAYLGLAGVPGGSPGRGPGGGLQGQACVLALTAATGLCFQKAQKSDNTSLKVKCSSPSPLSCLQPVPRSHWRGRAPFQVPWELLHNAHARSPSCLPNSLAPSRRAVLGRRGLRCTYCASLPRSHFSSCTPRKRTL